MCIRDRRTCPTDARGAHVHLTPAGRAAIEHAAPGHVAEIRRLFLDALTREQVEQLACLTAVALDRLAAMDALDAGDSAKKAGRSAR